MVNVSLLLSRSVRKPGRSYPRPSSSLFQAFKISRKIRKILINTFLLHYTIIYHVKRLKYIFNKNTIWRKKFGGEISIKLSTSWVLPAEINLLLRHYTDTAHCSSYCT